MYAFIVCALTENQTRNVGIVRWHSNHWATRPGLFFQLRSCPMDIYQGVCFRPWAGCWEMQSNKARPSSPAFERPRDVERGVRPSRCFIQNSAHERRTTALGGSWRAEGCGEHRRGPVGLPPDSQHYLGSSLAFLKQCWRSFSPTVGSSDFHFYMFILACVC